MFDEQSLYLHAFNLLPGFGPVRIMRLVNRLSIKDAFEASFETLVKVGIEENLAREFIDLKKTLSLKQESEKLIKANIKLLNFQEKNYPKLLKEIPKFPPLLYFRGEMPESEELCIAVVGSRKITTYGLSIVPDLVEPLVKAGVTIVSGMAFGVDGEAHKQAIKNNARTIAVLGGGLDDNSIYPKNHQLMADQILENGGALISEYPIGTPNFKQNFVARNRIISGLSMGTLVIECDLDSGSLITAKHALEQNRQIYAVPGPIYAEMSKGPNNLIKMGAKLVTESSDILEDLNLSTLPDQKQMQIAFGDTLAETKILGILSKEPMDINTVIKTTGLNTGDVTSTLTFLEMKGKVRNLGGQQYILSR